MTNNKYGYRPGKGGYSANDDWTKRDAETGQFRDTKRARSGDGYRKGSVTDRTQVENDNEDWTRRDTESGQFMDQKADGAPFKGVAKEPSRRRPGGKSNTRRSTTKETTFQKRSEPLDSTLPPAPKSRSGQTTRRK